MLSRAAVRLEGEDIGAGAGLEVEGGHCGVGCFPWECELGWIGDGLAEDAQSVEARAPSSILNIGVPPTPEGRVIGFWVGR